MWQNLIVFSIVALAAAYVVWNIYRGIASAAGKGGSCGGCGPCGCKSSSGGNLIQLSSKPQPVDETPTETTASAEETSAVSSQ